MRGRRETRQLASSNYDPCQRPPSLLFLHHGRRCGSPGAMKAVRPATILRAERTWMGVDEALIVMSVEGEEKADL